MNWKKTYIAIDLKSFYASVECIERGLDPMTTNLVVADSSRTEKTVCLAVSPSLKAYGISGRARLFEAIQKVNEENSKRRRLAPNHILDGKSFDDNTLKKHPTKAVDFIIAPPRMAHYMEHSTRIYQIYLKHISPEDIHVYSIDEVFIDATAYLRSSGLSAYDFTKKIIKDVYKNTGITATAGIGTNLYLAKIAMDIVAKHAKADKDGVRVAELDEMSYRRLLWEHTPLTDFWRIGKGYERTLNENGLYTMGDIARCSLGDNNLYHSQELLYKLFGVNAELLIDHAWGYEPCTIADIKAFRPQSNSINSGQVLQQPYVFDDAKLIVREMADLLALDLVEKGLVTNQIVLTVGYDIENISDNGEYTGTVSMDRYGRKIPKHAHGTENLERYTSSSKLIVNAAVRLFERIVNKKLSVRRIYISANKVVSYSEAKNMPQECEQLSIFTDSEELNKENDNIESALEKERRMQRTVIDIKKKYGKNAILKGMNLQDKATAKDRNRQIGGHKA